MWFWHSLFDILGNIIGYGLLAIPLYIALGVVVFACLFVADFTKEKSITPFFTKIIQPINARLAAIYDGSSALQYTHLSIHIISEIAVLGLLALGIAGASVGVGCIAGSAVEALLGSSAIIYVVGVTVGAAVLFYLLKGVWSLRANVAPNLTHTFGV